MGRALYEASAAARVVFDSADRALNEPFSKLVFEGPQEELTQTANAQPAILTSSIAALAAYREAHPGAPPPAFAAGHSLGEYSALVAAGALEFEAAVRLVRLRGEAMQRAVAPGVGAMAAIIGSDAATVEELCAQARAELGEGMVVSPANYNGPAQIVIAGHAEAVARASQLAEGRRLKAVALKVSAPFHCSLMSPAAEAVERALVGVTLRAPEFPVISNVEALPNLDPANIAALLVRQVASPVRWQETLSLLVQEGVRHAFEFGTGKVLAGLARKAAPDLNVRPMFEPAEIASARSGPEIA
jgi:[acyl-carrier-protein] S-malonyltransferase